jgi:hypothetical protein
MWMMTGIVAATAPATSQAAQYVVMNDISRYLECEMRNAKCEMREAGP